MSNRSGMDMNEEEIEFADHAALSVMEAVIGTIQLNQNEGERKALAREAYRMAKEMVVARRKFIQEHAELADPEDSDGPSEDEDLQN